MTLHCRMQPVDRQALVQRVPQIPHVHANAGVVSGDLLCDLSKRVYESGRRSHAEEWKGVDDAHVRKCLVIDVHEARDEGAHRLDEESRVHIETSIIRP